MSRKDPDRVKEFIAEQARILFSQKGYLGTSMGDICTATGISKGGIYHHFKSKESIFLFVAEMVAVEWIEDWEVLAAKCKTPSEKLYALGSHVLAKSEYPLNKAQEEFARLYSNEGEIIQKVSKLFDIFNNVFERCIDEGIINGEFKEGNLKNYSLILNGLLSGLLYTSKIMDEQLVQELYKDAINLFLNGIRKRY